MSRAKILESLNVNELSREIREINETNGWRTTKPFEWEDTYKVPAILALIHSEVSEAWIGLVNTGMENYAEELADVMIRILDMLEGLGMDVAGVVASGFDMWSFDDDDDESTLNALHFRISEALEGFRKNDKTRFEDAIGEACAIVFDLCRFAEIDLAAEIRAKLEKNRQRGYRHGGKRV